MKFATYLLPFLFAISSSSAKDFTPVKRKLQTKTTITSGDDGYSLFEHLARDRIIVGFLKSLYALPAVELGRQLTVDHRDVIRTTFPHYVPALQQIGLALGDTEGTLDWEFGDIYAYIKETGEAYYPTTRELAAAFGFLAGRPENNLGFAIPF